MITGTLDKMYASLDDTVKYQLPLGDEKCDLNPLLGHNISINYSGNIYCCNCGRKTKKSFSQGYCYPCSQKLAACDMCIVKPEQCHYDQGTCREPDWAQHFCFRPHYVYLSNTSGVKVGITRETQIPTRWIDQGAVAAVAVLQTHTRFQAGLVEDALKSHFADKTDWRKMLKGDSADIDLLARAQQMQDEHQDVFATVNERFGETVVEPVELTLTNIHYPVEQYPQKITSHNLDKVPLVEGVLQGIKGQYLILDTGVINIRKFSSYEVSFSHK